MIRSVMRKRLYCDKEKLWDIITNNKNVSWRSDLSKIEIVDENKFIEYDKNGYPTYFAILSKVKLKEYQFAIENSHLKGNWLGLFKELEDSMIEIEFIETIEVKNFLMKLLANIYLKKQQRKYYVDLKRELDKK